MIRVRPKDGYFEGLNTVTGSLSSVRVPTCPVGFGSSDVVFRPEAR